ncbi:unnamed protein product, partial [marine sediment metagenome]
MSDISNYIEEAINSFFSLKCQYNNVNSNNKMAEYNVATSLFNQNPNNLPNRSPFQSQNQIMNPYSNNYPFALYQNYKNIPENPNLYQNNIRNPYQRIGQIQTPEG